MDYHRLGLGTASSLVQSVRIAHWGAIVLVDCIYDPLGERKGYQLSFRGCSQLRIDMMPDAPVQEQEADLLGISLGQEGGRQPAVLTTDLFELHVTYQQFQCIKDGDAARAEPIATAGRGRHSGFP
jgi:hypothetical protein